MPEGGAVIGINNGLNVLGYGSNSGMEINVDKNGTFTTKSKGGVLVNGTEYGTDSTYGVEKGKGVVAGTNLNMGNNQTIRGGLGNEGNFIGDLINFLKTTAKPKANRAGNP
ncbi:hypothetical protein DdX_09632 [Ditylenchus destructor]|uniref:Uncharacterized protein n=1 Tax=Ditylenchus destructor TaxID=166010 RepID=A0AAD4R6E8_9BILA|nr:hypothetical protein DdX_09632 [Ditylenchus destructor]